MRKLVYVWLLLALAIAAIGVVSLYTLNLALGYHLYDRQDELAKEAQEMIRGGQGIDGLLAPCDLSSSAGPFILVLDSAGAVTYTNAVYEEKPLTLPLGLVLTDSYEPVHHTYTPAPGLRFAVSAIAYDGGHLAVGISSAAHDQALRNAEKTIFYLCGTLMIAVLPAVIGIRQLTKER